MLVICNLDKVIFMDGIGWGSGPWEGGGGRYKM